RITSSVERSPAQSVDAMLTVSASQMAVLCRRCSHMRDRRELVRRDACFASRRPKIFAQKKGNRIRLTKLTLERNLCAEFYALRHEIGLANLGVIVPEYRVAISERDI